MFYLSIIVIAAAATAAMTRRSPRNATKVGVAAVVAAAVAVAIAEFTGNLLLLYLGALIGPFGVLVLAMRAVVGFSHRADGPPALIAHRGLRRHEGDQPS